MSNLQEWTMRKLLTAGVKIAKERKENIQEWKASERNIRHPFKRRFVLAIQKVQPCFCRHVLSSAVAQNLCKLSILL
ncbi:hypothetical protein EJB05_04179 [Eragrostis curvula]|uniref:Uncharacterized protein n=1 Tax=Eragrostis curvula TaxID=38414 RepID=A0A5J9W9Y2_9POAL|nr:hypothetical protein EJB05_04179 [Eragrostis curvula]